MIILILLLLVEAGLTLYRIKTRSMQHIVTAISRIAIILLLLVLSLLSVVTWGFRYYALAIVLVISAVINTVQILRKNKVTVKLNPARIFRKSVGMVLLLSVTLLPALIFPEYRPLPVTGEYRVLTKVKHFSDEGRNETYSKDKGARILKVEFWYPADKNEAFPLVIFSHGSFGTRKSNESLFCELASHGYVVCSVDHTYQCFYTTDQSGNLLLMSGEYFNEIKVENAKEDKYNSLELYKKWMDVRVTDMNFVIDTVITDSSDALYKLINPEKIGVMGHSLGGSAALGIGRMRDDISAVIALEAPFMCEILGIENNEFVFDGSEYPVPVLNVYSDSSWGHLTQWPQYGKNAELLLGYDKDAYNLHIAGVGHLSLTDLSLVSPILTRILNGHPSSVSAHDCLRRINEECMKFFDCYLKGAGVSDN